VATRIDGIGATSGHALGVAVRVVACAAAISRPGRGHMAAAALGATER
jgi:hypothetical protein